MTNLIIKQSVFVVSVLIFSVIGFASVKSFWPGQVLSTAEIAAKWGKGRFDKIKFKQSFEDERSKMAFDLVAHKNEFVGLDSTEIRKQLGDFDGFYFRDSIPTYMIYVAKNESESSWQIVFLLDNTFKVSDIIVQKNCCQ